MPYEYTSFPVKPYVGRLNKPFSATLHKSRTGSGCLSYKHMHRRGQDREETCCISQGVQTPGLWLHLCKQRECLAGESLMRSLNSSPLWNAQTFFNTFTLQNQTSFRIFFSMSYVHHFLREKNNFTLHLMPKYDWILQTALYIEACHTGITIKALFR